ncbi:alpha-N-acetylgalactosaminidase-like isoform X1 [Drosophila nasuta]|uniref:alpha-N-acetylgalactosaminidase-like isoform X1 n=2 Tax=Drosophila nasuta TaxID=42062 RepID=UPI00295ED85D|nr:alpha-N-acetylgalactosaminidase-like isoform X1 [Drosophila nasuta]
MSNKDCSFLPLLPLAIWTCCCLRQAAVGLENGLARTPPMGWMPFERFRCVTDCVKFPNDCISEALFKRTADLLVSEGYGALGYEYLIIDDCWMEPNRDAVTQKLVPHRTRFPGGMKTLSNYIHDKGLKFGLYHDIGKRTCMSLGPGAFGHFALDAQTFADWGVDYVKLDGCYADHMDFDLAYPEFGWALNKTGRPMVYSCSWPFYINKPNYERIKKHCNLWRFAEDVRDSHRSIFRIMQKYYTQQHTLVKSGGPGHWNDPDMLVLGNYLMSYDASRLQLAMWAVLAAPLIMSNDLQTVRPEIKELLQNRAIIEVDQDPLGIPGESVYTLGNLQVWRRPIQPINNLGLHSYALAFVVLGDYFPCPLCPQTFEVVLEKLGLNNIMGYSVHDLFNISDELGIYRGNDKFQTRINPRGVTFYKFKAQDFY